MSEREHPRPTDWRSLWPAHASAIVQATDALLTAINSLSISTGDSMVEAAAARWAIEKVEAFIAMELDADLQMGRFDDDEERE
jgi:hypothetical protein